MTILVKIWFSSLAGSGQVCYIHVAVAQAPLRFVYTFGFEEGPRKEVEVKLDPDSLLIAAPPPAVPPDWTRLSYAACENCPLAAPATHCPIAVNIADLVKNFRDVKSIAVARILVETPERTYSKLCAAQEGLSSLLGIYMAASGCPVMERLKPLVRFHLPFASVEETAYRVLSMYVTAQFHRMKRGLEPDWELRGLGRLYQEVEKVNQGIAKRIAGASKQDAALNALVNLDTASHSIRRPSPELVDRVASLFKPYYF